MKIFVILLLIISFQYSISNRQYYHNYDKRLQQVLDTLTRRFNDNFERVIDNDDDRRSDEFEDDPNDHVNVELWNRLNEEDKDRMPVITDYSDETVATKWLKWYLRISQRNHQV